MSRTVSLSFSSHTSHISCRVEKHFRPPRHGWGFSVHPLETPRIQDRSGRGLAPLRLLRAAPRGLTEAPAAAMEGAKMGPLGAVAGAFFARAMGLSRGRRVFLFLVWVPRGRRATSHAAMSRSLTRKLTKKPTPRSSKIRGTQLADSSWKSLKAWIPKHVNTKSRIVNPELTNLVRSWQFRCHHRGEELFPTIAKAMRGHVK